MKTRDDKQKKQQQQKLWVQWNPIFDISSRAKQKMETKPSNPKYEHW